MVTWSSIVIYKLGKEQVIVTCLTGTVALWVGRVPGDFPNCGTLVSNEYHLHQKGCRGATDDLLGPVLFILLHPKEC